MFEIVAADHDAVGGVVSTAEMVTVIDCVPPPRVVCPLPATSATENPPDAAKDDVTAPPPAVAVDVALTVHVVEFVCVIDVIAETFVNVRSAAVNVVQSIASLPVTVKEIDADVEVAADLAKVRAGGVVSGIVTATEAGEPDTAVCALPAVSATENPAARVRTDVRGVPATAVDVALMVHTVADVCTTEVIEEM